MHDLEYMSFGDALFLFLERPGTPLNIASVSIFEGRIAREELLSYISSRVPLMPRFQQKVVAAPLNIGLPHWETDENFDIHNHIHEIRLKRGTEAELKTVAGRLLSCVMDRSRPLWDLTLIHGLKGDRTGLLIRAHHAMADGVSGIALLNVLMDSTPEFRKVRRRKVKPQAPTPVDALTSAAGDLLNWWITSVGRVLSVETEIFRIAEQMVAAGSPPSRENAERNSEAQLPKLETLRKMIPEIASPAVRLPFNKICTGPQRFTWATIPFERIRRIKKKCGVTVNDVMLTVMASAYRDFAELHGARTARHVLRIVIPVNTRERPATAELGNQITFAPIDVPLRIRSLMRLLDDVHQRTQRMKSTGLAQIVALAGSLLGVIPPALQATLAPLLSQLPISLCNVICTNVPGPMEPRYMMGHKMVQCFPYVPIGGEMALNCAVLTYDGNAYFGFSGDITVAKELDRIAEAISVNFAKLEKSLGLHAAARKTSLRTRAKKKVPARIAVLPIAEMPAAEGGAEPLAVANGSSAPIKRMATAAG